MQTWLLLCLAIVAGAFIPVQTGMNVRLSQTLQHPWLASCTVFVIGAMSMLAVAFASRQPWPKVGAWQAVSSVDLLGGLLAAAYIVALLTVAPRLGAAATVAGVIVGQLACSVLLDHAGLFGFPVHTVSWQRLCGLGLLLIGAWIVKRF